MLERPFVFPIFDAFAREFAGEERIDGFSIRSNAPRMGAPLPAISEARPALDIAQLWILGGQPFGVGQAPKLIIQLQVLWNPSGVRTWYGGAGLKCAD